MSTDLVTLEQSLIDRLRACLADVHIDDFDHMPDGLTLSHPTGACYVQYSGREGTVRGPYATYEAVWSVHHITRGMTGRGGVYSLLSQAEQALTVGWHPTGALGGNRMRLIDEEIIDAKGTIYHFVQMYQVTI